MNTIPCRSCGARIGFIELTSGKKMPVDPEFVKTYAVPYRGTGPVRILITERGSIQRWSEVSLIEPGAEAVEGYESHWGQCSDPKRWRGP